VAAGWAGKRQNNANEGEGFGAVEGAVGGGGAGPVSFRWGGCKPERKTGKRVCPVAQRVKVGGIPEGRERGKGGVHVQGAGRTRLLFLRGGGQGAGTGGGKAEWTGKPWREAGPPGEL